MNNTIDVQVTFSYQGETHSPRATIDLDQLMERSGSLEGFHRTLAQMNAIDTYSYLYEVMEMQPLEFSNPQGLAVDCLQGEEFDLERFAQRWHEARLLEILAPIARDKLGITDLAQEPKLSAALTAAYRAGTQDAAK